MNCVTLIGRLTRNPELKTFNSGTSLATFTLAVDREFRNKNNEKETDFIDIQVWGKTAENCCNYIGQGSLVGVQGSIRIESYQDQQGNNRKSTKINANSVKFLDSKNKQNNNNNDNYGYDQNNNNMQYQNNNQGNIQWNNQGNNMSSQQQNQMLDFSQNQVPDFNFEAINFQDDNDIPF